jgi:hypothetical protein
MGKTYRRNGHRDHEELFIRSKRRAEPDLRKLARALLAIAQAEVAAEEDHRGGITTANVRAQESNKQAAIRERTRPKRREDAQ